MKMLYFLILFCFLSISFAVSQEKIQVYSANQIIQESSISELQDIRFANNYSIFNFTNDETKDIAISEIDSMVFVSETDNMPGVIYITYNGDNVSISNPFSLAGISISANGGNVTVSSAHESPDIEYHVSGKTENGSLSITAINSFILNLNNVEISNPSGPAIIVNSAVKSRINSIGDNALIDNNSSSKNGTIQSNGEIVFSGNGNLSINGLVKHAVSSEKTITVEGGNITIPQSITDGIHSEGFTMTGGSLSINAGSDAIDAGAGKITISAGTITINSTVDDTKGIKSDEAIEVNSGTIEMSISGAQSKGFSSKQNIIFNNGNISITASGKTVLEASGSGYDPSYCTAVKSSKNIIVNNGTIHIESKSTSDGGKGLSADGDIVINDGNVKITTAGNGSTYTNESGTKDSYTSCCIKSDANISILGGTISCSSSGTGGKGISADGTLTLGKQNADNNDLILDVKTSGERFLVSSGSSGGGGWPGGGGMGDDNSDYANPKAVKSEGNLTINSGTINIVCSQSNEGGEGLESKSTLTINDGIISVSAYDDCINASTHIGINGGYTYCVSSGNDAIDSNGTLSVSGGITIANGTSQPEEGFDCDNNRFAITGGIIIGTGGATSSPTTSACTQRSIKYTGTAGRSICIKNPSNEIILLYQMPTYSGSGSGGGFPGGGSNSSMVLLFSDPNLSTGTYTLQYGGTISGGTTINGYNTGGTYSGGSSKSFTISSMVTSVQ